MSIVDNPERVAAAGKAAVRIRQFYSLEELYGSIFGATEGIKTLGPKIADTRITVDHARSAVEQREDELLIEAVGKSETERKANYAQAKRQDERLRELKADLAYVEGELAQLEMRLETMKLDLDTHKTVAALTAAELQAIGAAATLEVAA